MGVQTTGTGRWLFYGLSLSFLLRRSSRLQVCDPHRSKGRSLECQPSPSGVGSLVPELSTSESTVGAGSGDVRCRRRSVRLEDSPQNSEAHPRLDKTYRSEKIRPRCLSRHHPSSVTPSRRSHVHESKQVFGTAGGLRSPHLLYRRRPELPLVLPSRPQGEVHISCRVRFGPLPRHGSTLGHNTRVSLPTPSTVTLVTSDPVPGSRHPGPSRVLTNVIGPSQGNPVTPHRPGRRIVPTVVYTRTVRSHGNMNPCAFGSLCFVKGFRWVPGAVS